MAGRKPTRPESPEATQARLLALVNAQPDVQQHDVQLAEALQQSGRLDEAMEVMYAATQQFPKDWRPYFRLGALMAASGNWAGAESCFTLSADLAPSHADSHFNRGVSLQKLNRHEDAVGAFERALTANANHGDACLALGRSYQALNAYDAALVAFAVADGVLKNDHRPLLEKARTLVSAGRTGQALSALDALRERFPRDADAHNARGIVLLALSKPDDAFRAYSDAIDAKPDHVEALYNRGNLLQRSRKFSAALADYERALALRPQLDWLRGLRLYTALHLFDWTQSTERLADLERAVLRGDRAVLPLMLQTVVDDPFLQQQAARIWMSTIGTPTPWNQLADKPSGDRIKVAYVSRDFRHHPVSFLIAEVIEAHDRERFEVIAINHGPSKDDPMRQRLRAAFDAFHDVEHLDGAQTAALCRTLGVDIAVDLTGLTEGARVDAFMHRAAPVQVLYLGYLGTSGTTTYDYLVADQTLVPAEMRACIDEKLLYLPWYQANDRQRPRPLGTVTRADVGLPDDAFVFCCFSNPCKVNPALFAQWAEILKQAPQAVLWVLEEDAAAGPQLRRHATGHGLDPARIVFAGRAAREEYLARLALADLFLDTNPYSAGTTASDALWMGLPVLTRIGRSYAARMAASVLRAIDAEELIARDVETYIAKAVSFATSAEAFEPVRQKVRAAHAEAALFDTLSFVRHWEDGLKRIHQRRMDGLEPADTVIGRC